MPTADPDRPTVAGGPAPRPSRHSPSRHKPSRPGPTGTSPSRRRLLLVLGAVLVVLAAVNVTDKYGPRHTGLVAGPLVAVVLVLLARRAGLTWHDLGLSRRTLLPGLKYAVGAVLAVTVVYAA